MSSYDADTMKAPSIILLEAAAPVDFIIYLFIYFLQNSGFFRIFGIFVGR